MRVLNLYAGIGGNRAKWRGHNVTAVEKNERIAAIYERLYPDDRVVVADAHEFLQGNVGDFDFVWSSPPCQSHSRMARATRHKRPRFVDLRLYEEVMFLREFGPHYWAVENVRPFYEPLIKPTFSVGRHCFWASHDCVVEDVKRPPNFINMANLAGRSALQDWLGIHFDEVVYYEGNHCPAQVLRNAVHPNIGRDVLEQIGAGGALMLRAAE